MNPAHHLFPQVFMERFTVIFQKFVGVITCPYGTGVIWCKTCKPHVTGCRSCTCLTCYRHIIQFQTVTGTTLIVDNTFESTCEQISGAFTEDFGCFWFVFLYHIPVLIQNLGIKYRFGVSTTVSDCSVGSATFTALLIIMFFTFFSIIFLSFVIYLSTGCPVTYMFMNVGTITRIRIPIKIIAVGISSLELAASPFLFTRCFFSSHISSDISFKK